MTTYYNLRSRKWNELASICLYFAFSLFFSAAVAQITPPEFANCSKIELYSFSPDCGPASAQITAVATSDCVQGGGLDYTWQVDLLDDGSIDLQGLGNLIKTDIPVGQSRVIFRAEDECGLFSFCERIVEVTDKSRPSIVTGNEYVKANFEAGTATATVPAADFILPGTKDNCTPLDKLTFLIELFKNVGPTQTEPDMDAMPELIFTCADFNTTNFKIREVVIWGGDEAGNWGYNTGYVEANDYYKSCTPNEFWIEVDEHKKDEIGKNYLCEYSEVLTVEGVDTIRKNCVELDSMLEPSKQYIIKPSHNTPFYKFSTYSMYLIWLHLNGSKPITSPYRLIAADVNSDCKVSISDIVELRKIILTPGLKFKKDPSWRFVAADFIFPDPLHPCVFDETVTLNGLQPGPNSAGFVVVQRGYVSDDNLPNNLKDGTDGMNIRNSNGELIIHIPNTDFRPNELLTVPIHLQGESLVEGYQFTLRFDPEKLAFDELELRSPELEEDHFGLSLVDDGLVLVSWIGEDAIRASDFELRFKTKTAGQLRNVLSLTDQYLKAEAYGADASVSPVVMQLEDDSKSIRVLSVAPNPFHSDLKVIYQLSETSDVTISFSDVLGRVIYQQKAEGKRGINELIIDGTLWPTGSIFYTLEQNGLRETHLLFRE